MRGKKRENVFFPLILLHAIIQLLEAITRVKKEFKEKAVENKKSISST